MLRELGIFVLEMQPRNMPELHTELVVEILRCCFALRLGARLTEDRWTHLERLCLGGDAECQDAGVSLLVDAPVNFDLDSELVATMIFKLSEDKAEKCL